MMRRTTCWLAAGWLTLAISATASAQFDLGSLLKKGDESSGDKIAYFKIGRVVETPQAMPPLFGGDMPTSMKELLERLNDARSDAAVKAVILDIENAGLGFAQLIELHKALRQFDAVDKEVYIHADSLQMGGYTLATAASHISIVPTGDVWITGLQGESPYLKNMLEKIGVVADFEHCGDFKTAAEILTRSEPSPQSQQMTDWLMDSIYKTMIGMIAESRGKTPDQVRKLVDEGPYSPEAAQKAGLIDAVEHRQDFIARIRERHGADAEIVMDYGKKDMFADIPEDPFGAWMYIWGKIMNSEEEADSSPSIAIVYVEGMIQTGSAKVSPFGGQSDGAYSTTIRRALDKAAEDDSVKAVVLRVDSPGGSATASEIIWDAGNRVAKKKPFIVSMGNVAGSGGYYVSCGAGAIFAESGTITGSIGVVGGKLVTTGGWNKIGVNWSQEKRGEMAGIMSSSAPFSDKERAKIAGWMNEVYGIFKDHVVKGREGKLKKNIDEMAGGRVYTGEQALELGLVDKIGGLRDAIKHAAGKAGVSDYEIRVIPEPPSIFEMLFHPEDKEGEYVFASRQSSTSLIDEPAVQALLPVLNRIDPLRVKAFLGALQCVDLIHHEGVAVVQPMQLIIH